MATWKVVVWNSFPNFPPLWLYIGPCLFESTKGGSTTYNRALLQKAYLPTFFRPQQFCKEFFKAKPRITSHRARLWNNESEKVLCNHAYCMQQRQVLWDVLSNTNRSSGHEKSIWKVSVNVIVRRKKNCSSDVLCLRTKECIFCETITWKVDNACDTTSLEILSETVWWDVI